MAVINLRNVPDELVLELKQEALKLKLGFHEYCFALLHSRGRVELTSNFPFPGRGPALPDECAGEPAADTRDGIAAIADRIKEQDDAELRRRDMVTIPVQTPRPAHIAGCRCLMCHPPR